MRTIKYIAILLLLLLGQTSFAQDFPKRPDPPRLVNDLANLFSPEQADALERKLVAYNDSTSTQIAVVTISDIKGYDITDFTDRLAMDWKVGQKGINNGLMILIVPKHANGDRGHVRISVGYGLEEHITDAISSKIINDVMIPEFRNNNIYGGVNKGVDIVIGICSGKFKADQIKKKDKNYSWIFFLIPLFILFIIGFVRRNRYSSYGSNGSGGGAPFIFFPGFGGGGGGFGDSGGSDFGGFGGFGGGDFGGGGASGSW
ncbi:TPM domain-containing protein [Paludibacter sp.]|uniref:TPM domain-containing protein n=1 Tax=Paludibacter sp. TaxID=1898105 RepID=UPI001354F895|nr:TPM domain-containing protein [Paludibacter sp.]MTK53791.1 TPM domain-containing protein [Paludibacter sp.]